ncbi:P-II family nitrogen regulator [Cognataquiflexum rubidum]|uniref:P-II family nitrogen regulator n=1 Tax=Cognataquiflexum rubidum TaxID=2922273 RepID=UPI001F1415FF|nr:P-II family nitrogen regulator [Cognataquiflexum rubidum]MCH6235634.1 P-II family nitrogen regulator [Cognataquiflexum rubidum]
MKFKIIMAMIRPAITEKVVNAARGAGATGDVVISGRGSGSHESKSFFGLTIQDQTEILMFLVEEHAVDTILEAIKISGELDEPGRGIAFVLNVEKVAGLESQMEKFKEQAKSKYL